MTKVIKWEEGKIIEIKGCRWDEGWEFDCPTIIYSPFKYYSPNGKHLECAIEDILIDFCVDGEYRAEFLPSDLKEFEWRGWSVKGFSRRRGEQESMKVELVYNEDGERWFEEV